jgi:hypothetical protein
LAAGILLRLTKISSTLGGCVNITVSLLTTLRPVTSSIVPWNSSRIAA